MFSLVIIDDELYMRRAIRSHMDLPLLNLRVSGEAGNGWGGHAGFLRSGRRRSVAARQLTCSKSRSGQD